MCANVTNGVLDFNLSVNIDILAMSTAFGGHYSHVFLLNICIYAASPSSCVVYALLIQHNVSKDITSIEAEKAIASSFFFGRL